MSKIVEISSQDLEPAATTSPLSISKNETMKAIKIIANIKDEPEPNFIQQGLSIIEIPNSYIALLFNFVLQMKPRSEDNTIGFGRSIGLIVVVAFLGSIILLPSIIIYVMKYKSPHDSKEQLFIKTTNYQNEYIMITSSIWIIMFCTIIFCSPIKSV